MVFALCGFHRMSDDDGRREKGGANKNACHHDGDKRPLESDGIRHDEAADGECEEEITDSISQQVEMSDTFASCSYWVVLRGVHVIDGRRMRLNSTRDYRFVGSKRVR